jgi:hypothetical protein
MITNAGIFRPRTNQSSKKVFSDSLLPINIPMTVPISIAIMKDIKTLFSVTRV